MFERFFMDGWWYVVKRESDARIIYLKSKSEVEAECFCKRLIGAELYAEFDWVRRSLQNAYPFLDEYAQNLSERIDRERMRQAANKQNFVMAGSINARTSLLSDLPEDSQYFPKNLSHWRF